MKRITNEEYLALYDMLENKIEEIFRHGYSKHADMTRIKADIDKLEVIKNKIKERIKF